MRLQTEPTRFAESCLISTSCDMPLLICNQQIPGSNPGAGLMLIISAFLGSMTGSIRRENARTMRSAARRHARWFFHRRTGAGSTALVGFIGAGASRTS